MHTQYSSDYFQEIALEFHKSMKSNRQLANHINLLNRKRFVLARMADGKTAEDLAQEITGANNNRGCL